MKRPTVAQTAGGFAALGGLVFAFLLIVLPALSGTHPLLVLSGSMSPTIPVGSMVFVETTPPEEIEVGDVITFTSTETTNLISHRVQEVTRNDEGRREFVTQGDANDTVDVAPVTTDRYVGRVAFSVPMLGHVRNFVSSPPGLAIMGALALLVLGVDGIRSHRQRRRAPQETPVVSASATETSDRVAESTDDTPSPTVAITPTATGFTGDFVEQQLMLVKLRPGPLRRNDLLIFVELMNARVVTISHQEVVLTFVGTPSHIDDITSYLGPFDIVASRRTTVARFGESPGGPASAHAGVRVPDGAANGHPVPHGVGRP